VTIEPYAFTEAERIRYGRYPVLDTILYRWARKIEETLFDHFRIELYAGCSVVEEMKFSAFYGSLKSARPIYIVELDPLPGEGLFVLDNRFAHICLNGEGAKDSPQRLSPENQGRLQQVVQQMMADLDESCADVLNIQTRLKKVTTYLFRARILNAYEPCLVAQIHLSGARVSSRLTWCFPRIMLDSVLDSLQSRRVIPSLYASRTARQAPDAGKLIDQSVYRLRVQVGSIDLKRAAAGMRVGNVLPLANEVGGEAVVNINGAPLLVGSIGHVQGRYAVKITGSYKDQRQLPSKSVGAFQPVQWPTALSE
jgi:flagellar motor switch protein FliM